MEDQSTTRTAACKRAIMAVKVNLPRFILVMEPPHHASVHCKVSNDFLGQLCVAGLARTCPLNALSWKNQCLACRLTGTQSVHSHFETVVLLACDSTATHDVASPTSISTWNCASISLVKLVWIQHNSDMTWVCIVPPSAVSHTGAPVECARLLDATRAPTEKRCIYQSELRQRAPSISQFYLSHSQSGNRLRPARRYAIRLASRRKDNILTVGLACRDPYMLLRSFQHRSRAKTLNENCTYISPSSSASQNATSPSASNIKSGFACDTCSRRS